ncbi:uncharacterized protein LOC143275565 [Babylonia areolata]|uniref:uncharacterized protein LOC143275565 n=1 Tax=Babylonia areolata TaxID=304850 RepID=UPI003FD569A9
MSQQHQFTSHLPRGVAASALAMPRAAPATMLRSGVSPTIQIPSYSVPAAPSVPTVSGSVTGLPMVRNPVISAIRTGIQPTTTAATGSVSLTDQRTSLIVQGPPGAGATSLQGQPLQITLTQRVNPAAPTLGMALNPAAPTLSVSEAMKLAPLGGKPVQMAAAQGGLLPGAQKVSLSAQPAGAAGAPAGMGLLPQIQHQAVLVASKAGGLQVSASVPAISISPMTAPMPTATVMTPVSSSQIPIAKVTPQRQQQQQQQQQQQVTLTTGLTVQMMTTSGSDLAHPHVPNLSTMATQAGGSQLLQLSQTQQRQPPVPVVAGGSGTIVAATSSSSSPAVLTSTATGTVIPQQGERLAGPTMLNLAAATPGQGQDTWLSQFIYPQGRTQLVSAPTSNTSAPLPRAPTVANTFFVPRPGAEPNKIMTNPTPNLTASLTHPMTPSQPTVLFNTNMVVEGLRQAQPLVGGTVGVTVAVPSSSVTAAATDSKPVVTLSVSSTPQAGLHQSIMVPGGGRTSDTSLFSSTSAVPIQSTTPLVSGNANIPVLSSNLGASALPAHLTSRATVASSLITMVSAHQSQPVTSAPSSQGLSAQPPGGSIGLGNSNSSSGGGGGGGSGVSPRPSILRKRNVDGTMVTPKKPNFSMLAESHSPRPDPVPPSGIGSPKTPATENSQSSTDTALSSNDGGTPTQNGDRIKMELGEGGDGPAAGSSSVQAPSEASPRKRARKQLFDLSRRKMNEENKDNTSTEEEEDEMEEISKPMAIDIKKEEPFQEQDEFIDEEGVRWTKERTKPTMSLMSDNAFDWKPRFNHFQRYSDVKSKDDRNPTLNELISQRGIVQKASGWRLYYVSAQVEDVMENEEDLEQRLEKLKERLDVEASSRPSNEQDFHRLLELARGNLQRCKVVRQQLQEAKANMLNLLRHEPKIKEIITKNLAKRTIKKKERS